MQDASSVVFSHNAFSGPNVFSVIFSTAGKPHILPGHRGAHAGRHDAYHPHSQGIARQLWCGVRGPL
jgi:hypothetical protein